ncbi:glycosyltransferase [Enterococcus sp. AZ140]|uniref:glycosyltransferase family 2 protein n=1 Tax=Enterococcus sp. AZ140 TaxID=2774731 RepID=UPI003F21CDA5
MNQNILVSVIIPFYKEKKWLKEAIESVLKQTYQLFEIVVINDGSPENIKDIEEIDSRIKIINKKNGGPASARNQGIESSKGEYVAFLDSDDMWLPKKLELQLMKMVENKSVWSQHNYYYMYDDSLERLKKINTKYYAGNVSNQVFTSFKIQTSTVMVKKKFLFDEYGNLIISFREDARYGQDMYFYLGLAKKFELYYVDDYLSYFRIRNGNAGFRGTVQINARQMLWISLSNDSNLYKQSNYLTKFGYKINNINYLVLHKFKVNEEMAKIINYPSKIIFKLSFIYENLFKRKKV